MRDAFSTSGTSPTRYTVRTIHISLTTEAPPDDLIDTPDKAAAVLRPLFAHLDADQEHLLLAALTVTNKLIGVKHIASGSQNQTLCDPKVIFRTAILMGASRIILAHNHPGGDVEPSDGDVATTRQLVQAGELLQVAVLSHIIVAGDRFKALAPLGCLARSSPAAPVEPMQQPISAWDGLIVSVGKALLRVLGPRPSRQWNTSDQARPGDAIVIVGGRPSHVRTSRDADQGSERRGGER